jgi:hypothetical protein
MREAETALTLVALPRGGIRALRTSFIGIWTLSSVNYLLILNSVFFTHYFTLLTFREDACQARAGYSFRNFSVLKKMALHVILG